ncbi:MAG: family N-acetyltransferase, partial [Candidatus Thermoplasmatota archaeon]|nr:family N-acetyltransferase [Candidatus Thermoplasmatota archaeon]
MATIKIQIREARIGDLGDITDLWEQMAEHHSRLSHHFTVSEDGKEKYSKYLARKFSEKSTKLIVATSGPKAVGY